MAYGVWPLSWLTLAKSSFLNLEWSLNLAKISQIIMAKISHFLNLEKPRLKKRANSTSLWPF